MLQSKNNSKMELTCACLQKLVGVKTTINLSPVETCPYKFILCFILGVNIKYGVLFCFIGQ